MRPSGSTLPQPLVLTAKPVAAQGREDQNGPAASRSWASTRLETRSLVGLRAKPALGRYRRTYERLPRIMAALHGEPSDAVPIMLHNFMPAALRRGSACGRIGPIHRRLLILSFKP